MKKEVVFIVDEGYVFPTAVAITSLIHNNKAFNIHIIVSDVCEESINLLKGLENDSCKIIIHECKNELDYIPIPDLMHKLTANRTALLKFIIPSILKECESVLYLDGDIIVKDDISELFSIDMSNFCVCAVSDFNSDGYKRKLGVDKYFNSGVMLLNLKKIREEKYERKLIMYRLNGHNRFMDQDAFNVVFKNSLNLLDFKYNTLYTSIGRNTINSLREEYNIDDSVTAYDDLIYRSKIVHFSGKKKPWKYFIRGLNNLYTKYVKISPVSKDWINFIGSGAEIFSDNLCISE